MATSQQVPFEPSLTAMLTQYLHQAAIWTQIVVDRNSLCHEAPLGSFQNGTQAIGVRLIGAKHTKVSRIQPEDVASVETTARYVHPSKKGLADHINQRNTTRAQEGEAAPLESGHTFGHTMVVVQ
jgi:hypothetical protein